MLMLTFTWGEGNANERTVLRTEAGLSGGLSGLDSSNLHRIVVSHQTVMLFLAERKAHATAQGLCGEEGDVWLPGALT